MEQLVDLVLLFFAYSFLGWCIEVTLKYQEFHRFINRGFLTGPVLPIYGSGAALITVVVGLLSGFESGYGTTFAVSFVLCGVLEYLTSYFLEKRFHARWWDYSKKPMNLHGRVWIGNLVLFGLGGVLIIKLINPVLLPLIGRIPLRVRELAAAILVPVFFADYLMSHFVMKMVKDGVDRSVADNTEAISREIRVLLSNKTVFHRRFAEAYPEVIYRTERINARMEAIRAETERLRAQAERHVDELQAKLSAETEQLAQSVEPSLLIKNSLLSSQDALIAMLYDEASATEEQRALMREIEEKKERLRKRSLLHAVHE